MPFAGIVAGILRFRADRICGTGTWDNIRKSTASNVNLGRVGMSGDLVMCVVLPNGMVQASAKMMAITVEALMGAVYLDAGIAAAGDVMRQLGIAQREIAV